MSLDLPIGGMIIFGADTPAGSIFHDFFQRYYYKSTFEEMYIHETHHLLTQRIGNGTIQIQIVNLLMTAVGNSMKYWQKNHVCLQAPALRFATVFDWVNNFNLTC